MNNIQKTIPIHIQRLGAVKSAKIEFKPLTIFVGENSTGKTYTAYLIAYIFSKYSFFDYLEIKKENRQKFKELDKVSDEIYKTGTSTLDFKKFIEKNTQIYINEICKKIVPNHYANFLASDRQLFDKVKVDIKLIKFAETQYHHLSPHFLHFAFCRDNEQCEACDEAATCSVRNEKIQYKIDESSLDIIFKETEKKQTPEKINEFVYRIVLEILHRSIFNETYFLGAERTGLSLLYHTVKVREKKKESEENKSQSSKKTNKGEVNILFSTPTKELFGHMGSIFNPNAKESRELKIRNEKEIEKYLLFAELLEKEILSGEIEVKDFKKQKVKKLMFDYSHFKDKIPLNMTLSASAVKGLSPLILYLRYFIEPNEFIVIDEPELNLHPRAQVQLIELLAMMANSNVNIIITTHSPYIVDHLINLIKASECKNKKKIAEKFYLKDSLAFIKKENVSAYLFEKNTATNILEKGGDINWKTFSKISEEITDLYFELDDENAL